VHLELPGRCGGVYSLSQRYKGARRSCEAFARSCTGRNPGVEKRRRPHATLGSSLGKRIRLKAALANTKSQSTLARRRCGRRGQGLQPDGRCPRRIGGGHACRRASPTHRSPGARHFSDGILGHRATMRSPITSTAILG
jgi:hypothetical protein